MDHFIKSLKEFSVNGEALKEWKYAGGDKRHHLSYAKLLGIPPQPYQDRCVCGHSIKENCYIQNSKGEIRVLGNCCIKKFVPLENQGRNCEVCGAKHRNYKDNLCSKCRDLRDKPFYCSRHEVKLAKEWCPRGYYFNVSSNCIITKRSPST